MGKTLLFLCLSVMLLATAGCGGGYGPTKPAASPTLVPSKPGGIAVSASYPRFQPSAISVAKGQAVQLKFTAIDTNHTFTIDALGINIAVGKGQTITQETKVEKAGTYTFYCSVPGHRGAGMEGTFRVTE